MPITLTVVPSMVMVREATLPVLGKSSDDFHRSLFIINLFIGSEV
jgi:hypothetical protein